MAKTKKVNKAKRIIWSSLINEDDYVNDYKDYLEMNGLTEEERSLYEYANEEVAIWADDEKANLNKPVGKIVAIADLGLWDGRHSAYQIINCNELGKALFHGISGRSIMGAELYCDRYNVRGTQYHHDGTNYILFREVKEGVNVQPLLDKIYNGEEIDSNTLSHYTRSLRKKVAKVYGW